MYDCLYKAAFALIPKLLTLLGFSIKNKRRTETWVEMMIFVTCNLNLPAHLEQFEQSKYNSKDKPSLNKRFTFPWAINMAENVIRAVSIWLMGSNESFDQMLPSLTTLRLLTIVFLCEMLVLNLWYIYFITLYIGTNYSYLFFPVFRKKSKIFQTGELIYFMDKYSAEKY